MSSFKVPRLQGCIICMGFRILILVVQFCTFQPHSYRRIVLIIIIIIILLLLLLIC
jgi:hypothetical protein